MATRRTYRKGYRHGRRDQRRGRPQQRRQRPSMWHGRILVVVILVLIVYSQTRGHA